MSNASPSSRRTPSRVPRRGLAALVLTATATALLFSFKTPSEMFASGSASTLTAGMAPLAMEPLTTVTVAAAGGSGTSEAPSSPPPATEPLAEQVIPGQVVRTPYGPVQVEVTVGPAGIVDVQALQLPYDRAYSARISRIVEPMLRDEALRAQSANVDSHLRCHLYEHGLCDVAAVSTRPGRRIDDRARLMSETANPRDGLGL